MGKFTLLVLLLFLTGCFDERKPHSSTGTPVKFEKQHFLQTLKESNLTMKNLVSHLYAVDGFEDGVPSSPVEAEFVVREGDSQFFYPWQDAKVEIFKDFVLVTFQDLREFPSIAMSFDKRAKLLEVLVLKYSFGNNEYLQERTFKRAGDGFELTERGYETEWDSFPDKGRRVLVGEQIWNVIVGEDGRFRLK